MSATIIASVITGGSNSHQTVSEELNAYATDFVNTGVLGTITLGAGSTAGTGAFAPSQDASPDMGVSFASGVAYVPCTPSGQDAQVLRARMTSNYTSYSISANSSGSTKYDWIYLQASAANASTPDSAADNVINLYTSRSTSNSSDTGSPPTYGILLCVVTVANGASSITNSNISDRRTQASLSSVNSGGNTGWTSLGYALSYSANNGNKEFVVTTPNNLTGLLSPGMKLSIARSVTPPTQSMSFTSASSQYASNSSPSGITFTSAFTCEAWIYVLGYTGQSQTILSRYNNGTSTDGWNLQLDASGRVSSLYGSGSGNYTQALSYQSVPLNQWVHVAATNTTSSKTQNLYINGTPVPSSQPSTTASANTQPAIGMAVGAHPVSPSNSYFNGYISEARVWSVAQTQANIQANMAISISGSASNLVAYFQGNGSFNDGTSNGNNLTASGGAIATQASNPYNATEYAMVEAVSYSAPTTTINLNTGTSGTIPNQTLNSPYYSTSQEPYGFPKNMINRTDQTYVPYKFSAYLSSAQNTSILITFQTVLFDTGSNYSNSTGKFTAPINGYYWFSAAVTSSGVTNGTGFSINLNKNGGAVLYGNSWVNTYNGANCGAVVSGLLQLSAGDYITVGSAYTAGLAMVTGLGETYFQGFLVSAT